MDTEYSYLYEDKYYENAVKNLKSTFYDVIEREEIMLNNLENRIASEADEGVKAKLLELWTKQNDSLDKSIVNFRHIKQSIRVLDSFVKELSQIDEQIVSDIINSTNVIRSSRIEQIENENVETTDQEVNNNEVVEEKPAVVEEINVEVPEETKVDEPEIVQQEAVQEQPAIVTNIEEKIVEEAPIEENVTIPEEKVKEEVKEESNVPELELVNEENDGMDLPNVVEPEKIDPESMKEDDSSQDVELSTEEIDLPFKVEAIPEEEQDIKEDTTVEEKADENIEETVEENKTDDISSEENNDSVINNEEIVEESNSDDVVQDIEQPVKQENESNEEPQLVVENVNEEVPLEEGFIDEPVMEEIPVEDNNSIEETVSEEVPLEDNNAQDVIEVDDSNRIPLRLLKTDLGQPKAIVVNETQYDRLYNSFGKQENKFFERGYLTTDLVANNNYVLGNMFGDIITDGEEASNDSVQEEVDMEQMLEQANELYKSGRVQEAQELIDKVTEMNRNKELVKAA